jgi:hypothetical protein
LKGKHFEVCGNVKGMYKKTVDLVKDNTKKKKTYFFWTIIFEMQEKGHNVLFQPRRNIQFGHKMAAVYVPSFKLIQ